MKNLTHFPDYKEGQELDKAIEYISHLFTSKVPITDNIYVNTTCTLDTQMITTAFLSVKDYIWKKRMEDAVLTNNFS